MSEVMSEAPPDNGATIRTTVMATPMVLPFLDKILELKLQFWSYPLSSQRKWFADHVAAKDLHVLAFDEGEALVGYTRIALDDAHAVGIIDTMCVSKDAQRRGVGLQVMQAANAAILGEGRTGLLSCDAALAPFYEACGWRTTTSFLLRADQITMKLEGRP